MNSNVRIVDTEMLSDNFYVLSNVTYEWKRRDGEWQTQKREVYDHGNGATVLLYNLDQRTVLLTRQFRLPAYLNGSESGMLIETCAGTLDRDNPEDCIRREIVEETGYVIDRIDKVFEAYMSPGSVAELVHFFLAPYAENQKKEQGGGLHDEEDIELLELDFLEAIRLVERGEIKDGKTIMLLQYAQLHRLFA